MSRIILLSFFLFFGSSCIDDGSMTDSSVVSMMAVGPTGVGKSTLLNSLLCPAVRTTEYRDCHFTTGSGFASVTKNISGVIAPWLGNEVPGIQLAKVFDTQGLGDTDGGDTDTLKAIVNNINSEPVQAILLLFKATDRFSQHIQKQLRTLEFILGPQLWDHVITVFTWWGFSAKEIRRRVNNCIKDRRDQFGGDVTLARASCNEVDFENEKAENLTESYEKYLNVTKKIPHAFPDPVFDYEDENEKTIFFANAMTIYNTAKTMSPLHCDAQCLKRLETVEIASRPEQIKEYMEGAMKIVNESINSINEKTEKVDALVTKGGRVIKSLTAIAYNFENAKKELRSARQTLLLLAEQAKEKGQKIIDNWDGQSKAVMKRSEREFYALLRITRTKFAEVKTDYSKSNTFFGKSSAEGRNFKEDLKRELDDLPSRRAAAYSTAGGVSGLMLFFDLIGCMGFCSGIGTTTAWTTSITAVEASIASDTSRINSHTEITEKFLRIVSELDSLTDRAVEFLEEETLIEIEWEEEIARLLLKYDHD